MSPERVSREGVYCLECGLEEETPEALYDAQDNPLEDCPRCGRMLFTDAIAARFMAEGGAW
jgi:hypothetical protein